MKKPEAQKVWQASSFLLCTGLVLRTIEPYDGTEFGGGCLTGPLLSMAEWGILLFLLAFVVTFMYPRVGAAVGLASSLHCLPLYLFFLAPVPFSRIFTCGVGFKLEPRPGVHWEKWTVMGLVAIIVTSSLCVRRITKRQGPRAANCS
jgi:hypothetical protein